MRPSLASQIHVPNWHCSARRFDVDIAVRRALHGFDKVAPAAFASQAPEFLGREDDNFVASMHRHVLWAFAFDDAHKLAETSFGVLQVPITTLAN